MRREVYPVASNAHNQLRNHDLRSKRRKPDKLVHDLLEAVLRRRVAVGGAMGHDPDETPDFRRVRSTRFAMESSGTRRVIQDKRGRLQAAIVLPTDQ